MCKEAPMLMLMYLPAILALELGAKLSTRVAVLVPGARATASASMRGFEACLDLTHESATNIVV